VKSIKTLVSDIYSLFGSGHKASPDNVKELAEAMATHVENAMAQREPKGTLRASIIGTKCKRKLWYEVNHPELAEGFDPWTKLKFLYGNLLEEIILFLAKESGHDVQKRQAEVEVQNIKGHLDGVIDGVLVDVKSASGYGMGKFKEHRLRDDDPFGYIKQITFYNEGMKDDPSVQIKSEAAFLAVDKSNGQLVLDTYRISDREREVLKEEVEQSITLVNGDIPPRGFSDVSDGASGNRKLCLECSYCPYKHACWNDNSGNRLRKFIYSTGPKWFTKIIKEPNVPEDLSYNKNPNRDSA
jgi:hypothetical protein